MNIELDEDVAAAFRTSTSVSRKKPNGLFISYLLYISEQGHRSKSPKSWNQTETNQSTDRGGQRGRSYQIRIAGVKYGRACRSKSSYLTGRADGYHQQKSLCLDEQYD